MGDLGNDTALTQQTDGHYTSKMSSDWEIWGPMGGYLAAFALRAAGAHCGLPRPASIVGHYLGVGNFDDDIDIHCTTLRTARTAQSVRTTISQGDRPLFDAFVWGVNDGLLGLEHQAKSMTEVPDWRDCPTIEERCNEAGEEYTPYYPFWANLDQRPPRWGVDWMGRVTGEFPPEWTQWLRFIPTSRFDDPWLDACRLLILVDLGSWPAVQSYHNQEQVMAPSIDIACEFHRIDTDAEWLFARGDAPSAADGLIGAHMHVWNDTGALLASGVSQLLCRPMPGAPRPAIRPREPTRQQE
jgi:acyl-CoA thioesterase-2